jgi:hypothetical protein
MLAGISTAGSERVTSDSMSEPLCESCGAALGSEDWACPACQAPAVPRGANAAKRVARGGSSSRSGAAARSARASAARRSLVRPVRIKTTPLRVALLVALLAAGMVTAYFLGQWVAG